MSSDNEEKPLVMEEQEPTQIDETDKPDNSLITSKTEAPKPKPRIKRIRSEKQKEVFKRAQLKRAENLAKQKAEKAEVKEQKKRERKQQKLLKEVDEGFLEDYISKLLDKRMSKQTPTPTPTPKQAPARVALTTEPEMYEKPKITRQRVNKPKIQKPIYNEPVNINTDPFKIFFQ